MIGIPLRFKTAVALVLLGLLTLLAGIGQKTFWAPAETVTATASAGEAAPLTVIDQKLRTLEGGTVTIKVKGEGSFLLAAGRPDDVDAWVGKTAHNTVTGLSDDKKSLQVKHTDGEASAPSPAGSDLWVSTENASGEMDYTWSAPADGDWSLLLAADGKKPAPSSISMTFPNDTSMPWAVPLMVLGGLLILAGGALLVLKPKGGSQNNGSPDNGSASGGSADKGSDKQGSLFARRARAKAAAKAGERSSSARLSVVVAATTAAVLAGTSCRRPGRHLSRAGFHASGSAATRVSRGRRHAGGPGRPVPPHPGTGGQRRRRRRRRQGRQEARRPRCRDGA